ncbi:MAG TPA: hypothetical protein C5S50_07185 [Methanosarcinaceae archaeon]|nr:hypothetical protein [Methanosarcinaceae archaeon]
MNTSSCGNARSDSSSGHTICLARPCVDEPGKYIAESQYPNDFSMDALCTILQNKLQEARISELRCSEKLGVARFELDGKTILLYRIGRIDIRRAADIADASLIIEKVQRIVKDAFTYTACD